MQARLPLAALLPVLLLLPQPLAAEGKVTASAKPAPCVKTYSQAQHARFVRDLYAQPDVKRPGQRRAGHLLRCQRGGFAARKNARAVTRRHRADYKARKRQRQQVASITPYNCGAHGNWAIPCSIIACESGYSWGAYNPSGASGPYQLLGKSYNGQPVTVSSPKYVHHQVAHDLWAGGAGRSHWVC